MSIIFDTYQDWFANKDKPFIKVSADDFVKELEKNTKQDIYLGNIEVIGDVNLDNTNFKGWFYCDNAKFYGEFCCSNAKFENGFSCNYAEFNCGFDCGSAKFEGRFDCGYAKFNWFYCNYAEFNCGFDCGSAKFERWFYCGNAKFEKGITTDGATLEGKKINFIKVVVSKCGEYNRTVGLFNLEGENYLRIGCQFDKFDILRQKVIDKYGADSDYVKKIDGLRV